MGNICGTSSTANTPQPSQTTSAATKPPSNFGKDPKLNPADFIVSGKSDEVIIKEPGAINGQQFIIEDCSNCSIYLLDHTATVQIDYCKNCKIFVGPCESSLFIRNSEDSVLVCAVQQFRTRDCKNLDIFLYCATEPIIETSSKLRLGCFTFAYFSLTKQFELAKLSVWTNKWSEVYDFTPGDGANSNWSALPLGSSHEEFMTDLPEDVREKISYSVDESTRIVPLTAGVIRYSKDEEQCFLCLFASQASEAMSLVSEITQPNASSSRLLLLRARQLELSPERSKELFDGNHKFEQLASEGAVVGLEFQGNACIERVQSVLAGRAKYFTTKDAASSGEKRELFFEQWKEVV